MIPLPGLMFFCFVFFSLYMSLLCFLSCLPRCKTLWPGWQKIEAAVAEIPPVPSTLNTGSDVSLCTKLQYKNKTKKTTRARYSHFFCPSVNPIMSQAEYWQNKVSSINSREFYLQSFIQSCLLKYSTGKKLSINITCTNCKCCGNIGKSHATIR